MSRFENLGFREMGCSMNEDCALCNRTDSTLHFFRGCTDFRIDYNLFHSWIEASNIKILYRIGRGQFGDVWMSTMSIDSNPHRIAVKMLPFVSKDMIDMVLARLDSTLSAPSQGLDNVCTPLGISVVNGKICIVSTLYEGSVGGRMAHLPGNKLPLPEVLRFCKDIAKGVLQLHSHDILSLNLKPCNFLLDAHKEAFIGDYGLPLLSSGCNVFYVNDLKVWLGTPNYMAPEQWNVETRGPLTYETDSWGFACSFVEMITGRKPWEGRSPREIYDLVVFKREKPYMPPGLPLGIERLIHACFEYEYRDRPDFYNILSALTSPDTVLKQGDWVHAYDEATGRLRTGLVKSEQGDSVKVNFSRKQSQQILRECRSTKLWRDPFHVGDHIREKQGNSHHQSEGVIIEIDTEEVNVRVNFCNSQELWEGSPDELELVSHGIAVGDWVHCLTGVDQVDRLDQGQRPSCVGIVHRIRHDGDVQVAFVGRETLWTGHPSQLTKVNPFRVGQLVKVNASHRRRFRWPCNVSRGRICEIMANGCLVIGKKERWWCDPGEVEVVNSNSYLTRWQWLVNPLAFTLGLLAGALVRKTMFIKPTNSFVDAVCEKDIRLLNKSGFSWLPTFFLKAFNVAFSQLIDGNEALLY